LEDDEKSLNVTLKLLNYFSDCSGLSANFDKTEAIWIGAKRGCVETIKTKKISDGIFMENSICIPP
jgi:hypothetical protein